MADEDEKGDANTLIWLKRVVGLPMLLVAGAYGYVMYHAGFDQFLMWRSCGLGLFGAGLVLRIQDCDDDFWGRLSSSYSNQSRTAMLFFGFLKPRLWTVNHDLNRDLFGFCDVVS